MSDGVTVSGFVCVSKTINEISLLFSMNKV